MSILLQQEKVIGRGEAADYLEEVERRETRSTFWRFLCHLFKFI